MYYGTKVKPKDILAIQRVYNIVIDKRKKIKDINKMDNFSHASI